MNYQTGYILSVARLASFILLLPSVVVLAAEPSVSEQPNAEVNVRDAVGNTSLHRAALLGDADAVETLLALGADAGATNHAGSTPLHYGTGNERIVVALLAHGALAD